MKMSDEQSRQAMRLVARIGPILAGQHEAVQSAVIADLLATWLAGHIVKNEPTATDAWREAILERHLELVRQLIPINAYEIHNRAADK